MKLTDYKQYNFPGIYLIKNTKTNHCYVGQARHISKRIYRHLRSTNKISEADYNYPLHRAIRKYGIDAFELEVLEKCPVDLLNEREQYWVSKFDSRLTGYNQTDGGYQSIRFIKLTKADVNSIKQLLAENKLTNAEIAARFKLSEDTIHRINVGTMWYDSDISYPIRNKPISRVYHYNGTCIEQYDLNNNLITKFISMSEAAKSLGKGDSNSIAGHISRCCNGIRKSAYGYKWKQVPISEEDWLKLIDKKL